MKSILTFAMIAILVLVGCAPKASPEEASSARQVVVDYYTALNAKDYRTMYNLISDGFKQIEPTANTYDAFEAYISKFFETANGIELKSIEIKGTTSDEVIVDYVAIITLKNGATKELKSTFTVKEKPNGWKLIHPYGEKKDLS